MKRIALITLFMALTINIFAQQQKNDTIIVNGDKVEIFINNNKVKIYDSDNGLKINVFSITEDGDIEKNPYYESRYENNINSMTEKKNITINFPINPIFIKNENHTLKDKGSKLTFNRFDPIYPSIYYSYSAMVNTNYFILQPQRANSFEWGSYFTRFEICHNKKKTLGLTTAIGISNTYNHFDYVIGTRQNSDVNSENYTYFYHGNDYQEILSGMEGVTTDNIKKSYLRYWSLRIPVNVQLQWRMGLRKMAFSFGPELEWRFGVQSKIKYKDGGKYTVSNNLAYNPFGLNALAVFSFEDFIIFGRAGLTQMFNQKNSEISVVPVNIGIGFSF